MQTVNELDYIYRKLVVKAQEKRNNTIGITDEDYDKYYLSEYKPEPLPDSNIPIPGEEDPNHDYSQDYLTFEALEDGTFSFTRNDLFYSTNNGTTWKSLAAGTETELITAGTKVLWKCDSWVSVTNTSYQSIGSFSSTGKFNAYGNILSLIYPEDFISYNKLSNGRTISYLFQSTKIISAKNLILPTELNNYCFAFMFYNCSLLIDSPKLLSNYLTAECYRGMFRLCTSLITAPDLLIISKENNYGQEAQYAYKNMFDGCTQLNYIKCLINDGESSSNFFTDWVKDVSPIGTFIKNSKTIFDIGPSGIPAGWEVIDEVVPEEGE